MASQFPMLLLLIVLAAGFAAALVVQRKGRFSLASLLIAMTVLALIIGLVSALQQWRR